MNSNDFDDWNREAILRAALEYRSDAERYRIELIHIGEQLVHTVAEHDRLREALESIRDMPEYDSDDQYRLRQIARAILQEDNDEL